MKDKLENTCDVYKEALTYIAYFDEELLDNIPTKVLHELNDKAADSKKDFFINPEEPLEKQNMSEEAKNLLALIFYNYVADEEEKKKLMKLWS